MIGICVQYRLRLSCTTTSWRLRHALYHMSSFEEKTHIKSLVGCLLYWTLCVHLCSVNCRSRDFRDLRLLPLGPQTPSSEKLEDPDRVFEDRLALRTACYTCTSRLDPPFLLCVQDHGGVKAVATGNQAQDHHVGKW